MVQRYWNQDNHLLIYNIDTYVEANAMNSAELKGDGFIPCFQAEGDHWSFVRLDENGEVVEIKEKERISNYCTLGAYYFKSCKLYEELYKEFCTNPSKFTGRMNMRFVKKYILAEQNNKCAICGMANVWNNKELIFILDHIDGDASNNKRSNFRLICPNCDSQLDTYKSKNKNGSRYYYRYGKKN